MKNYYYFSDYSGGSDMGPLSDDLSHIDVVIIDNNVCQHLSRYLDKSNNLDGKVLEKIDHLLDACSKYDVAISPYIGLTELSTNRLTRKLDRSKYKSHLRAIKKTLKQHKVKLATALSDFKNGMSKFDNLLSLFYAHSLKIKQIESNGLSKNKSYKNLVDYLEWAESIRNQTIYPSQVAHALFGGESKARKVIKFEKDKDPLQSIFGAAWDMLYLFISQQYIPVMYSDTKVLFATNDEAIGLIGSLFTLRGTVVDNSEVKVSLGDLSYDFPHFNTASAQNKIENIHVDIRKAQASRIGEKVDISLIDLNIKRLEKGVSELYENRA